MPVDYEEMVRQLARLPGGPAAAVTDFIAPWLAAPQPHPVGDPPCWPLREGGRLCLRPAPDAQALLLAHDDGAETVEIARFGRDLTDAAAQAREGAAAVSPLVLALLAIAAGDVDDGRRLKRRLPGLDGAARDLMLMTLCRLCG